MSKLLDFTARNNRVNEEYETLKKDLKNAGFYITAYS